MNSCTRKPVPGFEGFYEVADDGKVHSVGRTTLGGPGGCADRFIRARVLKTQQNRGLRASGVARVNLFKDGVMTKAIVKHLVADAFLARRGEDVRMIDGDAMNCAVSNLQLVKP